MVNYKKLQSKKEREAKGRKRIAEVEIKKQELIAKAELEKQITPQNCPEGTVNLQFTAIDTWFFRESRPHDAVGASELSSLFPPPVRTLMGAVRSFLGDSINVNWQKFNDGNGYAHDLPNFDLKKAIGNGQNLGDLNLSVNGPWVCNKNGQRLYPAPFYLMHKKDNSVKSPTDKKEYKFVRLQIGDTVECDLGKVRLPELPKDEVGYKGLEQTWITSDGWRKLLAGKIPANKDVIKQKDLFRNEARLGIARDNSSHSVIKHQLYQTQHVRLQEGVSIELDITKIATELLENLPEKCDEILRLGGEGRMAALIRKPDYLPLPRLISDGQPLEKITINFITAADFNGKMFPEKQDAKDENDTEDSKDFFKKKQNTNGQTMWEGELKGIKLIIEAAVIGKVHREGGWDMQKHQPRAVKSYIPAGSAWFCRVVTEISDKDLLDKLHGQCIGAETEWGRGQILIGWWNDNTN